MRRFRLKNIRLIHIIGLLYLIFFVTGIVIGNWMFYDWAYSLIGFKASSRDALSFLLEEGVSIGQMLRHSWLTLATVLSFIPARLLVNPIMNLSDNLHDYIEDRIGYPLR